MTNHTVVIDASALLAALVEPGERGDWARAQLSPWVGKPPALVAPHLLFVEVASALQREERKGALTTQAAEDAVQNALDLSIELFSYRWLADRAWGLRANFSAYDAWYVALAAELQMPLVTLDTRLTRAPKLPCQVLTLP